MKHEAHTDILTFRLGSEKLALPAEYLREMRKRNFSDAIDKYFRLGRDLNQRDTIAVRKTVSGLL